MRVSSRLQSARALLVFLLVCSAAVAVLVEDSNGVRSGVAGDGNATAPEKPRAIKGRIRLNDRMYETQCNCQQKVRTCHAPRKARVHLEAANREKALPREKLRTLLTPSNFTLVEVEKTYFSCLDGRYSRPILGTPGGDFGEFLLALSVAEISMNKNITEARLVEVLREYLGFGGPDDVVLYHCQDEDAVSHLAQFLEVDGQTGRVVGLNLQEPPSKLQAAILKELKHPQNHGDYFVKSVLENPDDFYVRPGLIHSWIRAFYTVWWDKTTIDKSGYAYSRRIKVDVLQGKPKEKAWINFQANAHCEDENMAPAFAPKRKVFANHPRAVSVLRRKISSFLAERFSTGMSADQFLAAVDRMGARNNELYAERRALAFCPFYTVVVE